MLTDQALRPLGSVQLIAAASAAASHASVGASQAAGNRGDAAIGAAAGVGDRPELEYTRTIGSTAMIRLNQIGYLPGGIKIAVVPAAAVADAHAPVVLLPAEASLDRVAPVWSGRLKGPLTDPLSGESVYQVDFTSFSQEGRYVLRIGGPQLPPGLPPQSAPQTGPQTGLQPGGHPGAQIASSMSDGDPALLQSLPFTVGTDYLPGLFATVTRSYYLQRCGIEIHDPISGLSHAACHAKDAFVRHTNPFARAQQRLDATGGWHDAGDYGKYSTTTAVTAGQLLLLYELSPAAFPDGQLEIPESGNGVPDLLDEARVGLEWLLRMQRPDGAVYHKLGPDTFPGMYVSPEKDRMPRYIAGVTSQDTAKAAAVWAMGARLFRPYDPSFANRLLAAARQAWTFLTEHLEVVDETRPQDNTGSGAYGDGADTDDRYWAAAELYVTTRESAFAQYLRFTTGSIGWNEIGWTDASAIGLFDVGQAQVQAQAEVQASAGQVVGDTGELADLVDGLRMLILDQAAELASSAATEATTNPYGVLLSRNDFTWASNKLALARGVNLLLATRLAPEPHPEWVQLALRQLDWVLGANPMGKCFITGVGANPVENPHHRPSAARWQAVPGLLVGGPNSNAEDRVAPPGRGPLSYIDDTAAYSVNEPAIDYNAPLVVLLGYLLATEAAGR